VSDLWDDDHEWADSVRLLLEPGTVVICEVCDQCGNTELVVARKRNAWHVQRIGYIPLVCACGNADLALSWDYVKQLKHFGNRDGIVKPFDAPADHEDTLDPIEIDLIAARSSDPNH
jgi:hypothetical protein